MIILNECSGIYRIDCNGECVYVGQSINLKSRKSSHLRRLRNNNHYNIYLQRLYNKYGENFIFNKIEECEPQILTEREMQDYQSIYLDLYSNMTKTNKYFDNLAFLFLLKSLYQ